MLTSSGLRLGIGLPQVFTEGRIDTGLIRDFAVRAEQLGYEDLWLTENILSARPVLDPVSLLSYVAAVTQRIRLGVSVIILNQRNPVQLAKALASLDQLSGGRLTAGIGLGGSTAAYPAFGLSQDRPVARFTESLRVMRALWSEERVDLDGDWYRLAGVAMEPKPLQQPLPVWFGGHAPAALRRAVRLGDGWMGAGSGRLADFFNEISQVRSYLTALGRDDGSFPLSKRIYLAVDPDEERAREQLVRTIAATYGPDRPALEIGVAGTVEQCVSVLRTMRDAGLHHLLLQPCGDPIEQLDLLTTEIAPAL